MHGHRHPDARRRAARAARARRALDAPRARQRAVDRAGARAGRRSCRAGLTRVFYSDAGATAVEAALRIALQYQQLRGDARRARASRRWSRPTTATRSARSASATRRRSTASSPAPSQPAVRLTPPHVFRWQRGHGRRGGARRRARRRRARRSPRTAPTLAALIVEPLVQGAAGMWIHPPAYLRALHELARRHGALLIADEVATGFGRTGRMFACEHAGITPDLLCLAKGISGGYLPLAATLATEEVFAAFLGPYEEFRAFFHGHTYTGNPLACAVGAREPRASSREERTLERLAAEDRARCASGSARDDRAAAARRRRPPAGRHGRHRAGRRPRARARPTRRPRASASASCAPRARAASSCGRSATSIVLMPPLAIAPRRARPAGRRHARRDRRGDRARERALRHRHRHRRRQDVRRLRARAARCARAAGASAVMKPVETGVDGRARGRARACARRPADPAPARRRLPVPPARAARPARRGAARGRRRSTSTRLEALVRAARRATPTCCSSRARAACSCRSPDGVTCADLAARARACRSSSSPPIGSARSTTARSRRASPTATGLAVRGFVLSQPAPEPRRRRPTTNAATDRGADGAADPGHPAAPGQRGRRRERAPPPAVTAGADPPGGRKTLTTRAPRRYGERYGGPSEHAAAGGPHEEHRHVVCAGRSPSTS